MTASALAAVALLAAAGCGTTLIPGTQVDDTPKNREIYDVVEAYRLAMEERDMTAVQKLVSRRYYENASTTNTSEDDYGFGSLESKVIPKLRDNVKNVQYRILLMRVTFHGVRATAEYEYFWKFQFAEGGREEWKSKNDFNRLDLVLEDGSWRIIAGL